MLTTLQPNIFDSLMIENHILICIMLRSLARLLCSVLLLYKARKTLAVDFAGCFAIKSSNSCIWMNLAASV